MRRFMALYANELIRITHRINTYIFLGLMILVVVGSSLLIAYMDNTTYYADSGGWMKENLSYYEQDYKRNLALFESNPTMEVAINVANVASDFRQTQFAIENELDIYDYSGSGSFIQQSALDSLRQYFYMSEFCTLMQKVDAKGYLTYEDADKEQQTLMTDEKLKEKRAEYAKNAALYTELLKDVKAAIINNSYADYIAVLNKELDGNDKLDAKEKQEQKSHNEQLLKANPKGEIPVYKVENLISEIETAEKSLKDGINYVFEDRQDAPLSSGERERITNLLAVNRYTLENGLLSDEGDNEGLNGYCVSVMAGFILLSMFVLVLAGSAVSQEIATGSIKSLIIAPVRRRKILTAKIAAILTAAVAGFILMFGTALLMDALTDGGNALKPYIYAVGGTAHELNGFTHLLCGALVDFADVIFYILFALTLSTVTRNTAVSVAGSVALLLVNSTVSEMIYDLGLDKLYFVRFLPFMNLSISDRVFEFTNFAEISAQNANISVLFSVCYLAVSAVCMLWITYDSFCRRDLK